MFRLLQGQKELPLAIQKQISGTNKKAEDPFEEHEKVKETEGIAKKQQAKPVSMMGSAKKKTGF